MRDRRPSIERILSQAFSNAEPGDERCEVMGAITDYCNDHGAQFDILGTNDPRPYRAYIEFTDAPITDCERVLYGTLNEMDADYPKWRGLFEGLPDPDA